MSEYLWLVFVLMAAVVGVVVAWYILARPTRQDSVRVSFELHKDRELNERFVDKGR